MPVYPGALRFARFSDKWIAPGLAVTSPHQMGPSLGRASTVKRGWNGRDRTFIGFASKSGARKGAGETMALLDASTGLRASELIGLRWNDIDFDTCRAECHQVKGRIAQIDANRRYLACR
jgi:hypothetical protein